LALDVAGEGEVAAEEVNLDAVVDHEVGRDERVHPGRVPAHRGYRVADCGQVDDAWDPGEVLEDDPGRHEGQLGLARLRRIPRGQGADVARRYEIGARRRIPERVLEEDLDGVRQPIGVGGTHGIEAVVGV